VCKARSPECWRCEVVDLCGFKGKILEQGGKPATQKVKSGARKAKEKTP